MCVCVCVYTFCDVVKRVDLRENMLFAETSLVKPESLYAYYNAMLIQRINFLLCVIFRQHDPPVRYHSYLQNRCSLYNSFTVEASHPVRP